MNIKTCFKIVLLTVFTLAFYTSSTAQKQGGSSLIKVTGKVIDKSNGTPLEFATVSLFSAVDSTIIGGGLTEMDGSFSVDIRPGKFYGLVEFLYYKSLKTHVFQPIPGTSAVNMGEILLSTDAVALEAIQT